MHITEEAPPAVSRTITNKRYYQLCQELIAHPGEWLAIPLDEISGATPAAEQNRVINAARQRGIRVKTRTHDGKIHVMNVTEVVAEGGTK
jgi:hypothetical protein